MSQEQVNPRRDDEPAREAGDNPAEDVTSDQTAEAADRSQAEGDGD